MKRFAVSLISLLVGINAFSQTVITGKVTNDHEDILSGANAYLQGTYDGASANEKGIFKIKTSKQGEQILSVEFVGYEPVLQKLKLTGDTVRLTIRMKEAFNQLDAVTISAGTFEASDKKQAVTITPLDMMTTAGAAGDVYGALQSLPGTTVNPESGRLFVKGGDSEESQTYIDGSLVYVPYNSSAPNVGARGRFNPFMFKGTTFSTGGFSAEYGQALSSVLLLNTNDMPSEGQLDLSFLSVGLEFAGTKLWKTGAITATTSYNNLSPYMSLIPQNFDWSHAPESGSGAVSIRQKTGKSGMLKLYSTIDKGGFTIMQKNLDAGGSLFDYKLNNDNYFMNGSWNGQLSERWLMSTATSYTSNFDKIRFGQTSVDKETRGVHLKQVFSYLATDRFTLKMGGEFFSKTFTQKVMMPAEVHDNSFTNHQVAGFTELQIYASTKFVTRIGGRAEYSSYLDRFRVSPRISTAYKITDATQLSAAYGWFYQNPIDNNLLYTNRLKPERADHYTFTFLSAINQRTIRAEVYYKDYKELTKLNGGQFYLPATYTNSGNGYAKGLDLFWRDKKSVKNGDYWISYSYLDTKRNYQNYPGTAIPSFASKHNLSVVYKHWFGGIRSLASVNFRYSSPRVYNNPNSTVFNGDKMLAYRSLDLSCSFLYRQNIIVYGAVTNVLGFRNEYGQRYSETPDINGQYASAAIRPSSNRFVVLACFITLTRKGNANQLDKID